MARDLIVEGRFTPRASLSEGALSRVLAATDADGREVVIKRIQTHLRHDAQCRAMFEHESRILTSLTIPGLPRLLARGEDAHGPYFVMPRLPGAPPRLDPASAPRAVAVARGVLEVLQRVHLAAAEGISLHIVHRDVCPANVLLSEEGAVSLLDFGIATSAWRDDPERGVMKGSRGYMSPEVITGDGAIDARADLFAVGVMLTELLASRRLFEGAWPAVLDSVVEGEVRGPLALGARVSAKLDAVARRALAKRPDERFASAAEFLSALDDAG